MTPRTWLHGDRYLTASEIAALHPRLNPATVKRRLYEGWSVAAALSPRVSASDAGRIGRQRSTWQGDMIAGRTA